MSSWLFTRHALLDCATLTLPLASFLSPLSSRSPLLARRASLFARSSLLGLLCRTHAHHVPMSSNDCFCFTCQWFDPHAQLMRKYQMMFYVRSSVNEIELTDVKTRKLFLRRTPFPDINFEDLFVGSKIMIYSRQVRFLREADGMDSVLSAGAREGEEYGQTKRLR